MKNWRRLLILSFVLALSASSTGFACWQCKYSPSGWGFCRTGFLRGHGGCSDIVVDRFNGTTDCEIASTDWGTCGTGIGDGCSDGSCEEHQGASLTPCGWTDKATVTLL